LHDGGSGAEPTRVTAAVPARGRVLSSVPLHPLGQQWDAAGAGSSRLSDYDVVVLDRDVPGLHGDDLCRRLRAAGAGTRALMLTGAAGPRLAGEGWVRMDYLAKPFEFVELIARVEVLARRQALARPPVLKAAGIRLDPATRSASRSGRPLGWRARSSACWRCCWPPRAGVSAEELLEKV
jgi:DNA-binding response OmpR family regulator